MEKHALAIPICAMCESGQSPYAEKKNGHIKRPFWGLTTQGQNMMF